MLLAFVPLFFAVASLTRATVLGAREQSARALGRAIAAHVSDARENPAPRSLQHALDGHTGWDSVDAICVFGPSAERLACAGSPASAAEMRAPPPGAAETASLVHGPAGR